MSGDLDFEVVDDEVGNYLYEFWMFCCELDLV